MRKYKYFFFISIALLLHFKSSMVLGQITYRDYKEMSQTLKDLQSKHPSITKLISLTKTQGGKDIWVLEIFKINSKTQP